MVDHRNVGVIEGELAHALMVRALHCRRIAEELPAGEACEHFHSMAEDYEASLAIVLGDTR
jgi:hypothetical protein